MTLKKGKSKLRHTSRTIGRKSKLYALSYEQIDISLKYNRSSTLTGHFTVQNIVEGTKYS